MPIRDDDEEVVWKRGDFEELGAWGLEILISKHMWKSKIGLLEQIKAPYDAFCGSPCSLEEREF